MKFFYVLQILFISQISSFNLMPRLSYDNKKLPIYKINLSLGVKERYKDILLSYKEKIKTYSFITSVFPYAFFTKSFSKYLVNRSRQDREWYEYIEAVSELTGITLNEAVMLSVTYDIACTSVIVQDIENKVLMGRNLDFSTYFVIAHLMFEAEYYRDGILLYKGIELAGFRGGINGIKPGKFVLSLNLRRDGDYRLTHLSRVYSGKYTPNFYLMKVLDEAESYQEAESMLRSKELSAAVYFILAGIESNEGVIITRDWNISHRIDKLDVDAGRWFLVVTNTDLDKEEKISETRRAPAEENIKKIGRENINYEYLFSNVMSIFPTNNLITAFTSIQAAGDGYFNTTMWIP